MRNAKFQSQPGSNCDSDRLVVKLIIIIIIVAKIKVTLSHENVAGALYTGHCRKYGIGQMSVIQQQQQQHSKAYVQSIYKAV